MFAGDLQIGVADESCRRDALELTLRSLPADHRAPLVESLGRLRDEPLGAFDALVAVRQKGRVVAAAWVQPQPGRTASVWLPEAEDVRLDRVSGPLLQLALQQADAAGIQLSQALVESDSQPSVPDLVANGFRRLTDLHYLEWLVSSSTIAEPPANAAFSLAPIDSLSRTSLEELVTATYEQTLDCPELDGLRPVSEVLDGYQQTGDFDPALWFVLQYERKPAGVLFLNEHRASRQVELTYMGISPEYRGRRLGYHAVAAAQQAAERQQAERVVLAVDDRNSPARAVYQVAGFKRWASRIVFVRPA